MKKILSPKFILLAVLLITLFGLLLKQEDTSKKTQSSQAANLTKIKVGRPIDPGRSLPVLIAEKKGLFEKHNLSVKSEVLTRGIDTALISGQIDIVNDAFPTFLAAAVQGADLKLVGITLTADPYYIVANTSKKNIRKVAVNRLGGQDYYTTINSLRLIGVDPSKVDFVLSVDLAGKYPLLLRGNVDAAGYQPTSDYFKVSDQFKKDGITLLLDRATNPDAYFPAGIITRGDYLKENPEIVRNFILAFKEAVEYARGNKNESVRILMDEYSLKESEATFIYENFVAGTNQVDVNPRMDYLKTLLNDMAIEIEDAPKYDPSRFVDTSLAR